MTSIANDLAAMIRRYARVVELVQAEVQADPPRRGIGLRHKDPNEIRMVADRVELIDDSELQSSLGIEFCFNIEDRELGSHIEVHVGGWLGRDRLIGFRDSALNVRDVVTPGELMRDDEQAPG